MELVRRWLDSVRLGEYADMFLKQGYDDPVVIGELDDKDLCELGIKLPGHRKRILIHGKRFDLSAFEAAQKASTAPPAVPASNRTSQLFRKADDALPSTPSSIPSTVPDHGEVMIQNEGTSVFRTLPVTRSSTAETTMHEFISEVKPVKADEQSVWAIYEVFETPPIERRLQGSEKILEAQANWPKTQGCRFLLREIEQSELGIGEAKKSGKLDKRGGRHKNWKTRHFTINDTQLDYAKQQDDKLQGAFVFVNTLVYNVRFYKKAPRPTLCFCLRPYTDGAPVWPEGDEKLVFDEFDNGCKFMCANSAADRADWVASIQLCQQSLLESGQIYGTADLPVPQSFEMDDS